MPHVFACLRCCFYSHECCTEHVLRFGFLRCCCAVLVLVLMLLLFTMSCTCACYWVYLVVLLLVAHCALILVAAGMLCLLLLLSLGAFCTFNPLPARQNPLLSHFFAEYTEPEVTRQPFLFRYYYPYIYRSHRAKGVLPCLSLLLPSPPPLPPLLSASFTALRGWRNTLPVGEIRRAPSRVCTHEIVWGNTLRPCLSTPLPYPNRMQRNLGIVRSPSFRDIALARADPGFLPDSRA